MKLRNNRGPVKWILILLVSLFLAVFLILPLVYILMTALGRGIEVYRASITDPYAIKALLLTLRATLWAVAVNTLFGIAAAWCLTKFAFRGKKIISTLIDLPVTVSPIIAGLIYVLTALKLDIHVIPPFVIYIVSRSILYVNTINKKGRCCFISISRC